MTTPTLEEYIVKNNQGHQLAGPFVTYGEAKKHADISGGHVVFAAEDSARDFDSPEAAIDHEKKAGAVGQVVVGDGVYIIYPEGMGRRLYYHSGKWHVARRREPIEVPKAAEAPKHSHSSIPETPCELQWSKAKYGRSGHKWIARGGIDCGGYEVHPFSDRGDRWILWGPGGEPIRYEDTAFFPTLTSAKKRAELHFSASLGRAAEESPKGAATGLAIVRRNVTAVRRARKNAPIKDARDTYAFVHPELVTLSQEVVIVIPQDSKGRPMHTKPLMVAMGQRAEVNVAIEDILRPVVECNAAGFIVCHNHPSAAAVPSEADKHLTAQIKAKAFSGQPMNDHVVIGDGEFYSFADGVLYQIASVKK